MLFSKRKRTINRILIVEDEPLVAFDNEHLLSDAGYEVVATVDTVSDAVRAVEAEVIDLVLADVRLSDGNGLDVAVAAQNKGVPLLFVTGACPIEAQRLAIGCLSKPYTERDLLAAIEAADARLGGGRIKRLPQGLSFYD